MQRYSRAYRPDPDRVSATTQAREGDLKLQPKSMRRWRCPSCGLVFRSEIRRGVCPKRPCTAVPEEVW